ncbi:hypothetical protein FOH24_07710 [Acetobacter tropicalis]|nr:hypothetical protein FOH22_15365 [Acetobacter tropicalis]KAA8391276.1 hypothetical protein FOH24_07710 [Acetobacter tropicalis]
MAVTPAVTASQLDDARLFASHQRFHAVYSAVRAASREPSPAFGTPECNAREALFDKMVLEECDRLEELAAIPALTPQGQRLKAEIILALLPEHLRYSEMDGETQLILSLARDLVRENVA